MHKNRIWALLLLLCLSLLWGCGGETVPESTQASQERLPVAAVALPEVYDLPVKEALLERNWLLEGQPDVLITDRLPEEITVPVVLVGSLPESVAHVYTIDFDWSQTAQLQAGLLSQLPYAGDMNRDGVLTYAIIAPTGSDYKDACTQAMEGAKRQLLNVQSCKDAQSVGQQVAARLLASYGKDLDVLLCGSEALSRGAAAAVKDAGRKTNADLALLTVGQEIPGSSGTVYADSRAMIDAILAATESKQPGSLLPLTAEMPNK